MSKKYEAAKRAREYARIMGKELIKKKKNAPYNLNIIEACDRLMNYLNSKKVA